MTHEHPSLPACAYLLRSIVFPTAVTTEKGAPVPGPPARSSVRSSVAPTARRGQVRWLLAAAVLAAVLLVVAVVELGDDEGPGDAVKLEHVHGLAVDPADGALYAGTHHGLFRVSDTGMEGPVAGLVQDFMGFTVAGPDRYLASGHPGRGQGGPAALGLIESTDGGGTWTSRSLSGEADFHALDYRHDTVFGFDGLSGRFMVSKDLEEWEVRSETPMADFAISPESADTVLATTEQGLARSDDGGRTFEVVPDVPVLQLIAWAEDGTIAGVDPTGTVYVGADGPASLSEAGSLPGRPEALHIEDATTVYAASDGRLLASADGGTTFGEHPAE
jgi:hypothetical protein